MTDSIKKSKILIVEGRDEVAFIGAILSTIYIDHIQIWDAQGKDNIKKALKAIKLLPRFESVTSIGVIRDADDNPQGAFDSIKTDLQSSGYPIPDGIGQLRQKDGLSVSAFILPGANEAGMLETLAWRSVASEPIAAEITQFIGKCRGLLPSEDEEGPPGYGPPGWRKPRNEEKAKMHALLSTMVEAQPRMGIAAMKGYFDLHHGAFTPLSEYLRSL